MQTTSSISKARTLSNKAKENGKKIVLFPTLGNLHQGHQSLINKSIAENNFVVVCCFLNTLQFGPNENPQAYPQSPEQDTQICKDLGVSLLFTPTGKEFYSNNFSCSLEENIVSKKLDGQARPHLFKGHATYINILYNIFNPNTLVFGQKDIHQATLIKKAALDLHWNCKIKVLPTVRDSNNLAYSTANLSLEDTQLTDALKIYTALASAKTMVDKGTTSVDRIIAEVSHLIGQSLRLRINYVSIVDPETLEPLKEIIPKESLLCVSVWAKQVRLNDNILL